MNRSGRLIFEEPVKEDFKRFYEINADPDTNMFNPTGPMNLEAAEKAFNQMTAHWQVNGFGTWSLSKYNRITATFLHC